MRLLYLSLLAFGFYCSSGLAQEAEDAALAPESSVGCEEAITLFHDISIFGRRDRAAEQMTEKHAEMALSGWRFADIQIYSENGDLEGFYLTYTRAASCATTLESEHTDQENEG